VVPPLCRDGQVILIEGLDSLDQRFDGDSRIFDNRSARRNEKIRLLGSNGAEARCQLPQPCSISVIAIDTTRQSILEAVEI